MAERRSLRELAQTANVTLPFPNIDSALVLTAASAIAVAWDFLQAHQSDYGLDVATATEPQLTAAIVEILDRLRRRHIEGGGAYSEQFYEAPIAAPEMPNFDRTSIAKKPDIMIRPRSCPHYSAHALYWGLYFEAKLVDGGATAAAYGRNGIDRYVRGDYAWAVSQAFMLGYRGADGALPAGLTSLFSTTNPADLRWLATNVPAQWSGNSSDGQIIATTHDRPWRYPHQDPLPGTIEVLHLWLSKKS